MRLELTGRHVAITAGLRTMVQERLAHTLRKLNDSAVSAQVVLTKEKQRHHADVTLHARGDNFLHGEATGRDLSTAFGAAMDKVDRQTEKLKGKWNGRKRRGISAAKAGSAAPRPERGGRGFSAEREPEARPAGRGAVRGREAEAGPRIIRVRRYAVKPMSVEDAAFRVETGPDTFVVFRNAETDAISIVHRRKDGSLGLIEPD
jgi:putative sigma-54 modulation protein